MNKVKFVFIALILMNIVRKCSLAGESDPSPVKSSRTTKHNFASRLRCLENSLHKSYGLCPRACPSFCRFLTGNFEPVAASWNMVWSSCLNRPLPPPRLNFSYIILPAVLTLRLYECGMWKWSPVCVSRSPNNTKLLKGNFCKQQHAFRVNSSFRIRFDAVN